jgi:hypothetical protein
MGTVSGKSKTLMKISIKLNQNLVCEKICKTISLLVSDYQKTNSDIGECFLNLEIIPIAYTIEDQLPKIEIKV